MTTEELQESLESNMPEIYTYTISGSNDYTNIVIYRDGTKIHSCKEDSLHFALLSINEYFVKL